MSLRSSRLAARALFVILGTYLPATAVAQLSDAALGHIGDAIAASHKKQANSYLDSAAVIVFGTPRDGYHVIGDMIVLTSPGAPTRAAVLTGHFSLLDAIAFEKAKLTNPTTSGMRQATIDAAFKQVYGRPSTPLEQAQEDPQLRAGKLWYAPLVLQEQARLNADKPARAALVQQIYQRALGRPGTPAEVGYWTQRGEDYSAMIAAARAWLYSPPGAKDLIETVARAQAHKNLPTDSYAIKLAMAKYEPSRAIYVEMVGISGLFKK